MKKVTEIFLILAIISAMSLNSIAFGKIKGDGNISIKQIEINSPREIEIEGKANLLYIDSDKNYVKIETDSNLMEYVEIEERNGKLKISISSKISPTNINIAVNTDRVEKIELEGAINLLSKGLIKAENLTLEMEGSNDVIFKQIDIKGLYVEIDGSGNILASGNADNMELEINGSGDMNMKDVESNNVKAQINGSGDIIVKCNNSINAKIFGSGDIIYYGNPKNSYSKTFGSGSIKRVE